MIGDRTGCCSIHVEVREHSWNHFSTSTFIWTPGIELRSQSLYRKCLYPMSHITFPSEVKVILIKLSTARFLSRLLKVWLCSSLSEYLGVRSERNECFLSSKAGEFSLQYCTCKLMSSSSLHGLQV